jgi:hypothetical protein
MSASRWLKSCAPLLIAGALSGSCSDQQAGGGLLLLVSRDGPLPLDRLDLTISSAGEVLHRTSYRVPQEASLPTTFGITSNGNPTASVTITVTGWSQDQPLDRRDAIVTQVPSSHVALLKVVLSGRCTPQVMLVDGEAVSACGAGNTCDPSTGDCGSASIDARELPQVDPSHPPSGEAGAPGGGGDATGGTATGGTASGGTTSGAAGEGGAGAGAGPIEPGEAAAGGPAELVCDAGFDDCDDDPSDCETDIESDVRNCGACGNTCPKASSHGYCEAGACAETRCKAPLADCNFAAADGCEIDTTSADLHCLGCNQPCADPTPFCTPAGCASARDIELVSSDTVTDFSWDDVPEGEAYRHTFRLRHSLKTPYRDGDQGRALVVGAIGDYAHLTNGSLSYDGVPMIAAVSDQRGTDAQVFLYYLLDAALPKKSGEYQVELNLFAIPSGSVALQVLELKNVRQIVPVSTGTSNQGNCSQFEVGFAFLASGSFTYGVASVRGSDGLGPSIYPEPPGAWTELWPADYAFGLSRTVSAVSYRADAGTTLQWASEVCDAGTNVGATVTFARYGNDPIAVP